MFLFILIVLLAAGNCLSHRIASYVLGWLRRPNEAQSHLHAEIGQLRDQLAATSMVDQFAAYAKCQRRIVKLEKQLAQAAEGRSVNSLSFALYLRYGLKLAFVLVFAAISVCYRKTPVWVLRPEFDLAPVAGIVSFPAEAGVSVPFWILLNNFVMGLVLVGK